VQVASHEGLLEGTVPLRTRSTGVAGGQPRRRGFLVVAGP